MSTDNLLLFYQANIRSIMEYCCALMTNLTVSKSCKPNRIQSRVCALTRVEGEPLNSHRQKHYAHSCHGLIKTSCISWIQQSYGGSFFYKEVHKARVVYDPHEWEVRYLKSTQSGFTRMQKLAEMLVSLIHWDLTEFVCCYMGSPAHTLLDDNRVIYGKHKLGAEWPGKNGSQWTGKGENVN